MLASSLVGLFSNRLVYHAYKEIGGIDLKQRLLMVDVGSLADLSATIDASRSVLPVDIPGDRISGLNSACRLGMRTCGI